MSTPEVIASTPITLQGQGANQNYTAAVWKSQYGPDNDQVFGLLYFGYPTHMCYTIRGEDAYFNPKAVLEKITESFYFNLGGNGRPIYCSRDELGKVFKRLGILKENNE